MRVAFVSSDPGVPVFGSKGCSVHVQEMLRFFLREVGAEVSLYTSRTGGEVPAEFGEVVVRPTEIAGGTHRNRELQLVELNQEVELLLERDGPFDLVYERYALFGHAGMTYALRASIPGVLEVNAPLIGEQQRHRQLVHATEAEQNSRMAFDAASSIIAVADGVKEYVESLCSSPHKIHVVPNGVDPGRFRPDATATLPRKPGTFTVGFVGSLKPWHGLQDLVEAFRLLRRDVPEARLLVVGDGPERTSVEVALTDADLSDVAHFTGAVSHADVPGWLASMDVAVGPYPQETNCYFSPLKIFEYMAAGLPVVATSTGQIPQIVDDGETGILTRPGRPDELASALQRLYRDGALAASMSRAARERAVSRHTWSAAGHRILEIAGLAIDSSEVIA